MTDRETGKDDIYLSLMKPDKQLGEEGYVLTAGRYAGIEAPARQGACLGNPEFVADSL